MKLESERSSAGTIASGFAKGNSISSMVKMQVEEAPVPTPNGRNLCDGESPGDVESNATAKEPGECCEAFLFPLARFGPPSDWRLYGVDLLVVNF